jgi:hypothetical protein
VLFIEYDVGDDGMIEVVGLINGIEEKDEDPLGEDWMSWRQSFDDNGLGCVATSPEDSLDGVDRRSRADPGHCRAGDPGRSSDQRRGDIVSTTRSQLYRFARDLGNVEAVEHRYQRGGLTGAASGGAQREARRVIYGEGNRQINHFGCAIGLGPHLR